MSGQTLPRVLVVGQPFERRSGGGITLCNLFKGWPHDRLASVAVSGESLALDVCERVYVLGSDEVSWSWPLSLVKRSETQPSTADAIAIASTGSKDAPPRRSVANRAFRACVGALGVEDALRGMHLSAPLRAWIADFRPDVVYSQLSDLPMMALVTEILDETGAPFALHVMDDWPSTMYDKGLLAPLVRARALGLLDSLMSRATGRMAIGDAMAAEYLRRYGVEFVAVQNSVEIAMQDSLAALHGAEFAPEPNSPLRLVYAGRVGRANARSLGDVADVVSRMVASGAPIELRVHTASADHPTVSRISALPGVVVLPPVPYDRVPGLLSGAGALLLPLDFEEDGMRFAGLSMPTKIPEYMAAGRPVLTYAPKGSAAAAYARDGGWSLLVDEPDPVALESALARLVADPTLRESMGAAGRRLAVTRHDSLAVRADFVRELRKTADL